MGKRDEFPKPQKIDQKKSLHNSRFALISALDPSRTGLLIYLKYSGKRPHIGEKGRASALVHKCQRKPRKWESETGILECLFSILGRRQARRRAANPSAEHYERLPLIYGGLLYHLFSLFILSPFLLGTIFQLVYIVITPICFRL